MRVFCNILSCSRALLACFFFSASPISRCIIILSAACSDFFDGFLARKFNGTSRVGSILDPMMDKFFIAASGCSIYIDGLISFSNLMSLLSRDLFLCAFGIYLSFNTKWKEYNFQSMLWGKLTTTVQFIVLALVVFGVPFSSLFSFLFASLGILSLIERTLEYNTTKFNLYK